MKLDSMFVICGTILLVAGAHFANIPLIWIGGVMVGLVVVSVIYEEVSNQ